MSAELDDRCQYCGHYAWLHQPDGCKGQLPIGGSQMRFTPCPCAEVAT